MIRKKYGKVVETRSWRFFDSGRNRLNLFNGESLKYSELREFMSWLILYEDCQKYL